MNVYLVIMSICIRVFPDSAPRYFHCTETVSECVDFLKYHPMKESWKMGKCFDAVYELDLKFNKVPITPEAEPDTVLPISDSIGLT